MSDYRRWFVAGGTYFFTLVTQSRRSILTTSVARGILREAITDVRSAFPFQIVATCLLPEHWHLVMRLPPKDSRYAIRIKRIKSEFTRRWLHAGLTEAGVSDSRVARGERGIWQPRYWEHTISEEADLKRCCDYVHWNPVKHGLVTQVRDWPWSSFHQFVANGHYDENWGHADPEAEKSDRNWGE